MKATYQEYTRTKEHLKYLRAQVKMHNKRLRELQQKMEQSLDSRGFPGFYTGSGEKKLIVQLEETAKRERKPPKQQNEDARRVLESYGITNSEKVLEELMEARRGELVEAKKLYVGKKKKKKKKRRKEKEVE